MTTAAQELRDPAMTQKIAFPFSNTRRPGWHRVTFGLSSSQVTCDSADRILLEPPTESSHHSQTEIKLPTPGEKNP